MRHPSLNAIDLFAGAGGMSLGAELAGIRVAAAIEQDEHAVRSYKHNHPGTRALQASVENLSDGEIRSLLSQCFVLFGGPPCQGFSNSNTGRTQPQPGNTLCMALVRYANILNPAWVVMENVPAFGRAEDGRYQRALVDALEAIGYRCAIGDLSAEQFGVPQRRARRFIAANRLGIAFDFPSSRRHLAVTVRAALQDLPALTNGHSVASMPYGPNPPSVYAKPLRDTSGASSGHLVSRNGETVLARYRHIPPGGNWEDIPPDLMGNYRNCGRCHTGIYARLHPDHPAPVIGNYRKNMFVHPWEDRGLSVREAARLQSFPDRYRFSGSIGFQQQQVANAVPPYLGRAVFAAVLRASAAFLPSPADAEESIAA